MRIVDIIEMPSDDERDELIAFVGELTEQTGVRPLSDHLWLDLTSRQADGFLAVRVRDRYGTLALAQISHGNDASSLETAARPEVADHRRLVDDVVETAVDMFRRRGGGTLYWWLDDPGSGEVDLAAGLGLRPARELLEMRRTLPADMHATVATRPFVPGRDDDAWIEVNNRAFASHGEQGGWTHAQLAQRLAEPWFDADGFLLHERDGRIAAFCWTKLHHESDPVVGEIYVIAVDPDFQGRGLGTQLTLAGLDAISARGVTVASLYVDAHNSTAVALYERLGFTVHRRRQAFAGTF
jgi:mycothiol synthase